MITGTPAFSSNDPGPQIAVQTCLRQSEQHLKKPAPCGLSCFWLSVLATLCLKPYAWALGITWIADWVPRVNSRYS